MPPLTDDDVRKLLKLRRDWTMLYVARERWRAVAVARRLGFGSRVSAMGLVLSYLQGRRHDIVYFDWMGTAPRNEAEKKTLEAVRHGRLKMGGFFVNRLVSSL